MGHSSSVVVKFSQHHETSDSEFKSLSEVNLMANLLHEPNLIPKVFSRGRIVILD